MLSYGDIIYEYFDPSKGLEFMKLMSLNEQEQDRVLVNLATRLYDHIVNEVTDIDFGEIPKSKGDITRIPNYLELLDCINIIRDICIRCRQKTTATDTLLKAIDNLKKYKEVWKTSFNRDVNLCKNTYNTLAMAIVCGTSLIISTSIEYIKDPNTGEFDFVLDKVEHAKTLNSVLFKTLKEFNDGCDKGEFMKAVIAANEAKRNISESEILTFDEAGISDSLVAASRDALNKLPTGSLSGLGIGIATVGSLIILVAILLPAIRNAVSWIYRSRQKLSDYLAIQSALIEMNANNLRYNNSKSEEERNRIADKQMKWAAKFKQLSNKLSVKMKKAEVESRNTLEKESSEKYAIKDIEEPGKVSSLF